MNVLLNTLNLPSVDSVSSVFSKDQISSFVLYSVV